jgi:hypothetical protein
MIKTEYIKGEIIEIASNFVLIYCLMDEEEKEFQTRRFQKSIFEQIGLAEVGKYIQITIETGPGYINFEFDEIKEDLSDLFRPIDYFSKFKNTPFSGEEE